MRLSYTALFLVLGISGTLEAHQTETFHLSTTNISSANYLDSFETVRFRKRGEDDAPASLWEFDVSSPNDFCYNSTDEVVLWRPDVGKKGEELQMVKIDSEQEYSISWPTKRHTMAWPSSVSLIGGEYLIGIGSPTNKVNLHQIPTDVDNVQNWMAERGCIQQVEMLKEMENSSQNTGI